MDVMDDRFPRIFRLWVIMMFTLIADVVVVGMKTPEVMFIFVPAAALYVGIVVSIINTTPESNIVFLSATEVMFIFYDGLVVSIINTTPEVMFIFVPTCQMIDI